MPCEPCSSPARAAPQLFGLPRPRRGGLVAAVVRLARFTGEKRGRIGASRARPEGAALRDLDGRRERLRQIGEQRRHLGAGLETVLRRELAPLAVGDQPALGDADQRVVRLVVVARGEKRLVGRDQRHAARIGKIDQRRLGRSAPPPCRGAAVRHRGGRRTGAASASQRDCRERALAAPIARSSGPPGPPVSAIRPSRFAVEPRELDVRLLGRAAFRG